MEILEIKKEDLKHNIDVIKEKAKKEKITVIAVVKGNGYGLDLVTYSKFLIENGIKFLAVATTDEAIILRNAGIKENILMLSSTCIEEEIEKLIENDIILTIGSKLSAEIIEKKAEKFNKIVKAHIKIDTGFGRYGFLYTDTDLIASVIKSLKHTKIEGTFSHFSNAFSNNSKWTNIQFERFVNAIDELNNNKINTGLLHISNSAAFFKYNYMNLDAVRIGSGFLGRISVENINLKKIGILKSCVSEIKTLPKGYNISYLNLYKTKREMRVAIIPLGYFSGYNVIQKNDMFKFENKLRNLYIDFKKLFSKENIFIDINNIKCEVLGKIGMYHLIVDITNKEIKIEDIAQFDVKPIYVDNNIRREYV